MGAHRLGRREAMAEADQLDRERVEQELILQRRVPADYTIRDYVAASY